MKYTICRFIDGKFETDFTDDIVAWCKKENVSITGKHNQPHTRPSMQGEPILEGFAGPMGSSSDEHSIRYEDWKSHEFYGR